ncbi:hypothetical protein ACWEO2_02655 [Nocardia sp. NPDC004278]
MATFVFTYRTPATFVPGQPESLAAWGAWFANLEGRFTNQGLPTRGSTTVGVCGTGTKLAGYSLIEASDLDAAGTE